MSHTSLELRWIRVGHGLQNVWPQLPPPPARDNNTVNSVVNTYCALGLVPEPNLLQNNDRNMNNFHEKITYFTRRCSNLNCLGEQNIWQSLKQSNILRACGYRLTSCLMSISILFLYKLFLYKYSYMQCCLSTHTSTELPLPAAYTFGFITVALVTTGTSEILTCVVVIATS